MKDQEILKQVNAIRQVQDHHTVALDLIIMYLRNSSQDNKEIADLTAKLKASSDNLNAAQQAAGV